MIRWLASRWLRRRWLAVAPLALIVAVGTASTFVAVGAADRTGRAYSDYLQRAEVGDVLVNPSVNTKEIAEAIRSHPAIEEVTSDAVFNATVDGDESPQPRGEVGDLSTAPLFVRGSTDGRYVDMDVPVVRAGRLPTGSQEAVVSQLTADVRGIELGDILRITFWEPLPLLIGPPPPRYASEEEYLGEVIPPIGVEAVEVVGIVTLSNEVLPDELYPRQQVIVSPDVALRYDCEPPTPPAGATFAEYTAGLHPSDCATLYRFHSLSLAGGAAAVKATFDELVGTAGAMSADLAHVSDLEISGGEPTEYFLLATETDRERETVERAIRPTVVALVALAVAAAAVTLALASLALSRELRTVRSDQRQWHQLGIGSVARAVVVGTPLLLATLVGDAVGTLAGWLLQTGPLGLVRVVEPDPERSLAGLAILVVLGIGTGAVALVVATTAWSVRRLDPPAARTGRRSVLPRIVARTRSVAVVDGVRAASTHRTMPVIVSGALLTTAFVAASVFGASLSTLVSTPRSYGWPWDAAAMAGSGYGDLDLAGAARAFDDDPDVASWTALGFLNEVSLDGEPLMSVVGVDRTSTVELPLVRGGLPVGPDEIALGATTAADRDLDVGDTVTLAGLIEPREATVSGIVVFPTLGPILADRVSTGSGMLLPDAVLDELAMDPPAAEQLAAFVGVDLEDRADSAATRTRIQKQLDELDRGGVPTIPFTAALRPPEIVDASSTRGVPILVAGVLAVVTALGLAAASWASARARRRDLAVLRTLGFSRAQIRRSIQAQSIMTMVIILAFGTPFGVVTGRALWRAFADQLGVIPDGASLWTPTLVALAGGILLATIAAQVPARLATRLKPAEGLKNG